MKRAASSRAPSTDERLDLEPAENRSLGHESTTPAHERPNPNMSNDKRTRRTEEQLIADLEAKIAALRARAEAKKAQRDPALKHVRSALRAIDAAAGLSKDNALRQALADARSTLSACLSMMGVAATTTTAPSPAPKGSGGRRSSAQVENWSETLLAYVRSNPGQRGEQIAKALGTDVGTMRKPMQFLLAKKKVKTKGQRRGMTYTAS